MMPEVSILTAFAAGLVSFLSPCVLPLVPGYLSFISGVSLKDLTDEVEPGNFFQRKKRAVLTNALIFILGFSIVFILLGATATWVGGFLSSRIPLLTKLAGGVIILFGAVKLGLVRPRILFKEKTFRMRERKIGFIGTLLVGAAFAFGWTPCIGPILAGILAYAGTLEQVNQGTVLLSVYALGLGVPFLLTALGVSQFFRFFKRIKHYTGVFEKVTGLVMIALGVLIFTDKLILIPGYLPFLNTFAL